MKKIIIFLAIILLFFTVSAAPGAQGEIKPYYTGEAINYNNQIIFGTVNTGALELFCLENDRIYKELSLRSDELEYSEFFDLLFVEENYRLYVYAINGRYLYKYDATNLPELILVKKVMDNSGDYFYGLAKTNERIVSVGTRGVKTWNYSLQVVNSHDVHSTFAKNIKVSGNGNYFFKVLKDNIRIIDGFYRDVVMERGLDIRDDHIRNIYNDDIMGTVYVVDDASLKKIYFNGVTEEFNHISDFGYDADSLPGRDYVYFSDGIGVVKIRKSNMEPLDLLFTTNLGPGNGWAMGLRAVNSINGDRVILFNGDSILALDHNLDMLDYYEARESDHLLPAPLSLNLDKYWGAPGTYITVQGSGFGPNENVEIAFASEKWNIRANQSGDFTKLIAVPAVNSGRRDIKATGLISSLTYSVSFEVF